MRRFHFQHKLSTMNSVQTETSGVAEIAHYVHRGARLYKTEAPHKYLLAISITYFILFLEVGCPIHIPVHTLK